MSQNPGVPAIFALMAKPRNRSTLYRLIEAGQLAHRAFLAPMLERGLQPGDDALMLVLAERNGASEADLAADAGVPVAIVVPHLQRLIDRDLVERRAVGAKLLPGLALTDRGMRVEKLLASHWKALDKLLTGDLKKRDRKDLNRQLAKLADLLR
jgi:DNA-binding MarR family transcriptional regulator